MKHSVSFRWLFLYFLNAANGPLEEEKNTPKSGVLFGKQHWDSNMCAQLLSCVRLFDAVDCGLPGSSVHGILQERILELVAIPFSSRVSWAGDQTHVC